MILKKRILQLSFLLALVSSSLIVSAQVRVIDNKGTVSTIDTSRAITGAAIYTASPEQYTLSATSAVKPGMIAIFTPTSANTTTTPLLKAGAQAAGVVITKNGHQALVAGDIAVGVPVITIFDGTNWVLQTPQGSSTGSIATIGTPTTSYAAGANLSGNTFTLGLADAANPGLVSTGSQTFSGQKIFNNSTTVFGVGEGATPTTTFIRGPQAGGNGTAGADLYIQASNGTGAGGSGNIVFQTGSASTISSPTVSTIENRTFGNSNSHTFSGYMVPAAGTNKLLLVEINLGYTNLAVSSVTYNSSSLNQLGYITSGSNRMEIWYLIAPVTDTSSDIVVNLDSYAVVGITAMAWTNVNQSSPFGAVASTSNGFGATVSLSPSSSLGQVVMDFLTTTTSPVTPSSGQNLITSASNGSTCYGTSGYRAAMSGTTTMSYTFGSSNYGYMAFAINPSSIGGSNALTDALKINNSGNTVLSSGKKLVFTDSSTGTVGLTAPSSVTGYTLTLPTSAGSSNELLTTDGSGNLSWTNATGGTVTSVSTAAANNGVTATWATNTTTPALTIGLGAITPTSVNGLTLSSLGTGFSISGGTTSKTLTLNNALGFSGTDGSALNIGTGGTLGTNAYTSTAYAPLASPTFTGTVTIPTPFTLGAVSVTSTGTQLNYLNAATGTTGTANTNLVFSGSPTLTTPVINGTITGTTVFSAANGGTGQSSYTTGDLIYASGASALSKLADVATGNALISGGVGVVPSWGKIGLTTHVSGILPGANGGTGVDNTGKTITLGGNFTTSGAFATTLTTTGTTSVTLPASGTLVNSGVLIGITTLTTSSTSPYSPTAGTTKMLVYIVGGGGGGGGCRNSNGSASGGGGAGAVAIKLITHTGVTTYPFTVGTAGTAGVAGSGANGGTGGTGGSTTFNGVTVSGGAGGVGGTATNSIPVSGGKGGALPTGGGVNIPGDSGTNGVRLANTAGAGLTGNGASSPFGSGGQGRSVSTGAGGAASGYGAGGGGALGATANAGGAGTPGVIIIYEYK